MNDPFDITVVNEAAHAVSLRGNSRNADRTDIALNGGKDVQQDPSVCIL